MVGISKSLYVSLVFEIAMFEILKLLDEIDVLAFIKSHWNTSHKITHEYALLLGCSFWVTTCLLSSISTSINSRMYKKGFHELPELQPTRGSTPTAEVIGTNTHWLSWIQPTIFQTGHKQYKQINYTLSCVKKLKNTHVQCMLFYVNIRWPYQ